LSDARALPTLGPDSRDVHARGFVTSHLAFAGMVLPEKIVQLEIFPEPRSVVAVDPRVAIGPGTRVSAMYRVRYGERPQVHQVYHDRHGWYCAEHGPGCAAVADAADAAKAR
jgi:hypothetical protein